MKSMPIVLAIGAYDAGKSSQTCLSNNSTCYGQDEESSPGNNGARSGLAGNIHKQGNKAINSTK